MARGGSPRSSYAPMKVAVLTLGTRGDVQPYVALAKGLKGAGHDVRLSTSASFEPFVREHGVEYAHMDDALMQLLRSPVGRALMEGAGGLGPIGFAKLAIRMARRMKPVRLRVMDDSWAASRDADLVVYHPKILAGASIAEKLGVPGVPAVVVPMLVPTNVFPIPIFARKPLFCSNRGSYRLTRWMQSAAMGEINAFRREKLGLGPLPRFGGNPWKHVVHGHSTHVLPRPDDWPDSAHATGYWFLDVGPWEPPADLAAFLDAGDPPVYVGFGSMAGRDPEGLGKLALEALERAGRRGLLARGEGGLAPEALPDSVKLVDHAPHVHLLPRVAAVVHHGGAGTTAAALRAGRPTVICPFLVDQPFWGARVAEIGAGPEPIAKKKLTAEKLAAAIRRALEDESIRRRAREIGEGIRSEDGVARAVEVLENIADRR